MQNFRKIYDGVHVVPLLRQLEGHPELWNVHNLRTTYPGSSHAQASDIWLRFNDMSKYGPENLFTLMDDLECIDYPALTILECWPLLWDLMSRVKLRDIGRIIITKLPPGGRILSHIDQGKYAEAYQRFHITLQNSPGSIFRCGAERLSMLPGEVWWFDTSKEHEVINASNQDRITLIVDLK